MSHNNTALSKSRLDPSPIGGDGTKRQHDGTNEHQNSILAKQVRTVPIDLYQWQLHTYANPQIQGYEDWRPVRRMGMGELQDMYAERFKVNNARLQLEVLNSRDRRHIIRTDVTMDNIPTMTMGSSWFKNVQEKNAARMGGRGRMLFNRNRTYGQG